MYETLGSVLGTRQNYFFIIILYVKRRTNFSKVEKNYHM